MLTVHMCGYDVIWRGNYFGGESIVRAKVEVRVGKLKNGKASGKDEITEEMIKGGCDRVVDWIWRLCNMAIVRAVVPEDWRSAVIVPLYKGKGERTDCKNYRGISFLSVDRKTCAGILVDRVRRVTGGLIDDKQGDFREGRGCVV